MRSHWLPILGLAVAAMACGSDKQEAAATDQAQDTVAMNPSASSNGAAGRTTLRPAGGVDSTAGVAQVIEVQEEAPGMIAKARYQPLDAQHIAQGKFPTGTVEAGFLERRGDDMVYRFRIRDSEGVRDVLVNSFDGKIINAIRVQQ